MGTRLESQTQSSIQNKGASDPIDPQRFLFVRAHHMHTQRCGANKNIVFLTRSLFLSPANTLFLCATNNFASFAESTLAAQKHNTGCCEHRTSLSFYLKSCLYFSIIIFVRRILLSQPLKVARESESALFSLHASATIIKNQAHTQQ
jgi:hypothetical protein